MLRVTKNPTANVKLIGTRKGAPFYATYRAVGHTCPTSCTLLNAGCYAQGGRVALQGRGAFSDDDGAIFATWAAALPADAIVRIHVSGDVMTPAGPDGSDTVDVAYLQAMADATRARPDITVYGYTHAWRMVDRAAVDFPGNFVLNASCDTPADVVAASAAGWPTTTVVPSDTTYRRAGSVVVCPEQTSGIPCIDCGLCMRPDRALTVGFIAHGQRAATVDRGLALPMA